MDAWFVLGMVVGGWLLGIVTGCALAYVFSRTERHDLAQEAAVGREYLATEMARLRQEASTPLPDPRQQWLVDDTRVWAIEQELARQTRARSDFQRPHAM